MYRLFHLDINQPSDRNAWYLIVEMFWASFLSAVTTFNSTFAVRLGSSNTVVGLLTSAPALMAVLVSIPAGKFLKSRKNIKSWILGGLFLYRVGFLLVAVTPWLPKMGIQLGELVVFTIVVTSIPAHFFNVGFYPLLAMVLQEDRRSAVFSARNIVYNSLLSVCTLVFGIFLTKVIFPLNYQLLYIFGFATSMLSLVFLLKIDVPDSPAVESPQKKQSMKLQIALFRQGLKDNPGFLRFCLNTVMYGMGLWAANALYSLYYVRELGASDAWVGLLGTVGAVATIIGYAVWRRIIAHWGESNTLKRTIVLAGIYPAVIACVPSLPLILLVAGFNGLVTPGLGLAHLNTLLKVTPEDNRSEFTAIYMTFANLGTFIAPLIGVAIANVIGVAPTLLGCGIISIVGSTSFWWWPVQKENRPAILPGE
jgi:MFS family permease